MKKENGLFENTAEAGKFLQEYLDFRTKGTDDYLLKLAGSAGIMMALLSDLLQGSTPQSTISYIEKQL
jgi:hypothetical protein|tara:strand:- start:1344 stop:1547 length:204 start_codon:yes stop_codon:yes gene_type:complete